MEVIKTSSRIHPLVAGAAVAVMLVSLVGVAAITGVLPSSHSTTAPSDTATIQAPEAASASVPIDAKLAAENVVNPPPRDASAYEPKHRSAPHHTQSRPAYGNAQSGESNTVAQAPQACYDCGRIESIHTIQQAAKPSGLGVVAGAVLGGVLGHQVGGGNGQKLATVAGAVGGGYAGNEVEKRSRSTNSYEVRVRMEDGNIRTFPYAEQPGWGVGDRVRIVNGSLAARG